MDNATVLLIDDEEDIRHAIGQGLELANFSVEVFERAEAVDEYITRNFNGVLVTDIRLPGVSGLDLMRRAFEVDPAFPVILITGHGDVQLAVEAMRSGAYDFLEKPFPVSSLVSAVSRALDKRRLVLENRDLRRQISLKTGQGFENQVVGRSAAMVSIRKQIINLAPSDADILIFGETGAGKDVIARALHEQSARKEKPFVALNCGALPANLMESELFGHEQGAFTGANAKRVGKLEYAHGGTVFLDEIESMPLDLQVKLLRVIETRSIERLGSNKSIRLDVRFLTATKTDLDEAGRAGSFRTDLYYRLNVVSITIPPLRERKDDIPTLFHHLAREARSRYRRDIPDLSMELMDQLLSYDWPGNVRELRNIADRFVLGVWNGFSEFDASDGEPGDLNTLAGRVASFERQLIAQELERNQGQLRQTYERLGVSRKTLYDKIKKHGLDIEENPDV